MKCPKCNGKEWERVNTQETISIKCNFCNGKKELDWVEYIIGVERKPFKASLEEAIQECAKELSDQIDKDIIKELGVKYAK